MTSRNSDEPPETTRPLPYDLAPYRIVVIASIDESIAVGSDSRQQVVNDLQRVLSGRLRPLASVEVRHSIPLTDVGLDGLEQIAATAFESNNEPEDRSHLPGKVIGLRLAHAGPRFAVKLREWDGTVQAAGPVWERSTLDRRLLPHVVATLLEEVFRPVGLVTQVEGSEVELLMRGGELHQPGEREFSLHEGDYLVPFLRYLDRDRNVRRIQPIPWTLLRTTSIDRGYVTCEVVSAFGSPLAGSRRRVELVAVRVQPMHAEMRLTIIPRGRPDSPLAGTRVDVLPRLPTDEDPVDEKETLLTDRSGTVVLSGDSLQPLRYIRVFSGKHLLAQVPMLPGVDPEMVLEVPDDSVRLRVEGELSQLEGDLIDVVARRAVLLASMRAAIKQNKPDQFESFDERLNALPDLDRFERRLRTIRLAALGALQEKGDRAAQRNIGRLCDRVLELVRHHLDSDPVRALREEMAELRKATQ
ncbi:hypothetical protein Mal4_31960 [Maioricimonas rarisocia]|uniref:Uncharacterized protein n=1 Tax=Maioricimonas rarisocia TaxID=2528026 RepID=A0A517Z8R5_9PLAN|nr:hypothetical protein [Maioricimonas rarisocia]QDU38864.1 hypothetical protein Mal4_31960 [Maioricimonas rarisocia]